MFFLSKLFYNIAIRIYYIVALSISPFNKKASLWIKGRKKTVTKLKEKSIWFHCASLGEFEQARPLLEKIKTKYPKYIIVLSFYSPSGYEVRKNYEFADFIYYLPLDTQSNASKFIKNINPHLVFFVKYEFWYHFINQLNKNKIPLFLISGIFREKQMFFKPYGTLFRKMLSNFTHLFVQDNKSIELLKNTDINNVSQANDSRFDRVFDIYKEAKDFPEIENFVGNKKCIILGSSWLVDEQLFAKIKKELEDFKIIIAPHNLGENRMKEIKNNFPDSVLYSELTNKANNKQTLIINNMGMLSSIYKYGNIAYVGGGFGVSIHNILEAAVYSIPVIFGPRHHKMKEATDLIEKGGGFSINNDNDLENIIIKMNDEKFLEKSSFLAGEYVKENLGGTERVLNFLEENKYLKQK